MIMPAGAQEARDAVIVLSSQDDEPGLQDAANVGLPQPPAPSPLRLQTDLHYLIAYCLVKMRSSLSRVYAPAIIRFHREASRLYRVLDVQKFTARIYPA